MSTPSQPPSAVNTQEQVLLDQALAAERIEQRRAAFLQLLGTPGWRQVLAPHVISRQAYPDADGATPDWLTFRRAARIIALDSEKVHRSLELAGTRFSGALLSALAAHMRSQLVDLALTHLDRAEGPRAAMLQRILHEADPHWVEHPLAASYIQQEILARSSTRAALMNWLAEVAALEPYAAALVEAPPRNVEEWAALGKARLQHEALYHHALACVGRSPAAVHYLLRLDPVPEAAVCRVLSAARSDWLATLFEALIGDPFPSPWLIPLAEIAIQAAGRPMAIANAWVGASKLGRQLLTRFGALLEDIRNGQLEQSALWERYAPASAERALAQGRAGQTPALLDATALVRQCSSHSAHSLIREIISTPLPTLVESVLHPLVGINPRAALTLMALQEDPDETIASSARSFAAWPDVAWPQHVEDTEREQKDPDMTQRVSLDDEDDPR